MRLTRLRLSGIRRFRGSFTIPSFDPGLNLLCGPNEAGKSTIVRAIRAAFFERYRSTVVDDLIPRGETGTSSSPTVEVSFDIGETAYTLTKTFFVKKRCLLSGGPTEVDGDDAEEAVAGLLSFSYAGKGMSKPEHWGIPGLLWTEQGESHRVAPSVRNAADHLRTALESTVGAVASSVGDEVLATIQVQRDKLLTQTCRPRGDYEQAIEDLASVQNRGAELDDRIRQYQQDVDTLASLRIKHEAEQREKPWEAFGRKLVEAEAALSDGTQLQNRLDAEEQTRLQLEQTQRVLSDQVGGFVVLRADLAKREIAVQTAQSEWDGANGVVVVVEKRKEEARAKQESAAALVALAEREHLRGELEQTLKGAAEEEERLSSALTEAERDEGRLNRLIASAEEDRIDESDLRALEELTAEVQRLEATKAAAATGLAFEIDPKFIVALNGSTVSATGEQRITAKAVVDIAGVGSITVQPGANDLVQLSTELSEGRLKIATLCAKLGVQSVEEARSRRGRAERSLTEAKGIKSLLQARAPKGLVKLRADVSQASARRASAAERLQGLPGCPSAPVPTIDAARGAYREAQAAFQDASDRANAAAQQLAATQARVEEARREAQRLLDIVKDPQTKERETAASAQLLETKVKLAASVASLAELRGKLENAQLELLKLDVRRLKASADNASNAFNERAGQIRGLLGKLEAEGAKGLEEEREELRVAEQAASRRLAQLKLRAEALDLLVDRMQEKREALTRKLQAPLQARLDHYVRILFPQSRMQLNEDLTPGTLSRGGDSDHFEQLSYGAQEQTALISRLAYADLLKEAGKPTLIMLDDALVHSDETRLDQMKRVIYDGATRHQILLFTCHPERWDGLGVAPRDVRSFAH